MQAWERPRIVEYAPEEKDVLTLTAWFTAQDGDNFLATSDGRHNAINWCKHNGVTKVHLEAFGRGLYAGRKTLVHAKKITYKRGVCISTTWISWTANVRDSLQLEAMNIIRNITMIGWSS
jgi:hypothetical protein